MAKDYYVILGVGADATLDEIRSAYRRQAKKRHPDLSGEDSEPFLALREAYEVLCDPARRQAYDDNRARESASLRPTTSQPQREPLHRRRPPVEPLVPGERASSHRPTFDSSPLTSLMGDLFGQPWNEPTPQFQPSVGRRAGALYAEVSLSREEARYGGRVRIWLPVQSQCPACRGWGHRGFFECRSCLGSGTVVDERAIDVAFPGGLVDGAEGRVSLRRPGLPDLSLVLRFKVEPQV